MAKPDAEIRRFVRRRRGSLAQLHAALVLVHARIRAYHRLPRRKTAAEVLTVPFGELRTDRWRVPASGGPRREAKKE